MSNPPFVSQKVSDHGPSHPVVARLVMQTLDLLRFTAIDKKTSDEVAHLFMSLHHQLIQCHDIADRIFTENDRTLVSYNSELGKGNSTIPYVIGLKTEAESFLSVAKQYLRDLVKALNLLFGADLPFDAAVWWKKKDGGTTEVVKWMTKTYGDQHPITEMFTKEEAWVAELVKKRNAVEHPEGRSGTLVIENYKAEGGGIVAPSWRRDGSQNPIPTDIFDDIEVNLENMLTLAEDIVAMAVRQNLPHNVFRIEEIPVDQRDEAKPIRLKAVLVDELLRKLPSDKTE